VTAAETETGHWVQVETYPLVLSRWQCFTCGEEQDGYAGLSGAIEAADKHAEEHKP
jgi:hypothetical protein